jgi:Tfp pilus assembly major pilin PilA
MIVVAIIGILAAIALPAYQDYTIRTKVTEGLSLAGGAKLAVADSFTSNGALPADNAAAGLPTPANIRVQIREERNCRQRRDLHYLRKHWHARWQSCHGRQDDHLDARCHDPHGRGHLDVRDR